MPAGRPANPLKKIVTEIQGIEQFLKDSMNHSDPATMHGMQSRQREMMERRALLKQEYKALLRNRGFAIFLVGIAEAQAKFAQIASEFDCYVMSANILYDSLADQMMKQVRIGDIFTVQHIQMLDELLYDYRVKLGIASMPHPSISVEMCRPITDKATLATLIRFSIEKVLDTELATHVIEDTATDAAIKDEQMGPVLPVVLTGADTAQIRDFQKRIFRSDENGVESFKTFVISMDSTTRDGDLAEVYVPEINDATVVEALAQGARKFGFKVGKKTAKTTPEDANDTESVVTSESTDTETTKEN